MSTGCCSSVLKKGTDLNKAEWETLKLFWWTGMEKKKCIFYQYQAVGCWLLCTCVTALHWLKLRWLSFIRALFFFPPGLVCVFRLTLERGRSIWGAGLGHPEVVTVTNHPGSTESPWARGSFELGKQEARSVWGGPEKQNLHQTWPEIAERSRCLQWGSKSFQRL